MQPLGWSPVDRVVAAELLLAGDLDPADIARRCDLEVVEVLILRDEHRRRARVLAEDRARYVVSSRRLRIHRPPAPPAHHERLIA